MCGHESTRPLSPALGRVSDREGHRSPRQVAENPSGEAVLSSLTTEEKETQCGVKVQPFGLSGPYLLTVAVVRELSRPK